MTHPILRALGLLALAAHVCGAQQADPHETLAASLRADVTVLAQDIGPRHVHRDDSLARAERWIAEQFAAAGYVVARETYDARGDEVANLVAAVPGVAGGARAQEIIVIGAHYDTVLTTPGADDNASGVAALLALARGFASAKPARTVRFVAFAQEEPIYFQTQWMGSRVYARGCKERGETIVAMLSLETLGYYSNEKGSQQYPPVVGWFYPSRGNFVAFVGNRGSKRLVRSAIQSFRTRSDFPAEAAALPAQLPGIGWSDHWSFWQEDFQAIMVTDTAPFRNPHYHRGSDTVETLDYTRLARVVDGLRGVLADLADPRDKAKEK
ncbi:MAG: M20/M25/M40 family metallo-hydrolase [Opitutaceae bacterium]|nr:M20/M25/M40 family metallo-hydrolase [Opitutaceae bacterium]